MGKTKLVILFAGSLLVPFANAGDVARVHNMVTSIHFSPSLFYGQITLSVSSETISYEKELKYGETVSFSAADVGLSSLPDGHYNYSLTASPEFDQQAWEESIDNPALEQAFKANELANTHTQYGEFKVYLGQVKPIQDSESNGDSWVSQQY